MNLMRSYLLLFFCLIATFGFTQMPSDLSGLKASQISDQQLQQYVNQAKARNLTPEQLEVELLRRGFPPSEIEALKMRMEQINAFESVADTAMSPVSANNRRAVSSRNNRHFYESLEIKNRLQLFGSELFSNTNLSFEPDLRMATPKNYTIGPDDELILNIYGVNISQQNLKVSPEGNVNVRYAGIINVNGLTVETITALFKTRLSTYYPGLRSGQTKLQLSLGNIRSIRVILIGAINRPGTYTLPSLATLFNALYVSGGPAENGSFRNIELIRNDSVIRVADLYDFLINGSQQANVRLEDNDVIRVPFASTLVTLKGELNRPGIYELHKSESLGDAFRFAGGFKSKAFRGRITGSRVGDFERQVIDVSGDSLTSFKPRNGDEYLIDSVINRYENRVVINGAVFKQGAYALESGMTLKGLIDKAQGLREDVYDGRAIVVRTRPDRSKEYISVELKPIMAGQENGLLLVKDDSIHVASIFDLKDSTTVTLHGAVRRPGTYRFEDGLSLKSLILKADGFAENATGKGIEISRRKRDIDITKAGSNIVEIIRVDDSMELGNGAADLPLMPFDIISIKEDPYYKKQISVKISGEVLLPAVYSLQSREERLSSLVQRAGGILYTANIRGAKLVRLKKEVADTTEIKRLFTSLEKDTTKSVTNLIVKNTSDVAINLDYVLKHPGSEDDIILEEGDELIIPRINNTVSIGGEVFKPVDIMFEKGKSMNDYISDAGGVTPSAKKKRAFVIYANGGSARIKKTFGIFTKYPKIYPGSNIFVPQKPKKDGAFDAAKAGIFISAITALLTAVSLIAK